MSSNPIRTPQAQRQWQQSDERARLQGQVDLLTRELAESEARFRDVIERNADAIIVVDDDGIVRFANSEASALFDQPREKLIGTSFGYPMATGKTTELDLHQKGSTRVVEMRVVESQWQGKVACIASLRDVTERKHAEQNERQLIREQAGRNAAEQAARRFRFLAESSSLLSASLEHQATMSQLVHLCVAEIADWAVVYCTDKDNRLRRFEVAHRDPARHDLAMKFRESPLVLPADHPVEQTMKTIRPIVRETLTRADLEELLPDLQARKLAGQLGIVSYMMVPITARGRSLGAVALVSADGNRHFTDEDLALAENLAARAGLAIDNARLYEEAREANRTKTELLAVISHDLRTPLNSIIGYAQLLEMGIPDPLPPATSERVQRILRSGAHLLYLIDELLAFARVDGNHDEVKAAPVDAGRIVREVGQLMEPLALQKQLNLVIDVPDQPVTIQTDGDKLRQVLVNLVGNAVKYTDQGQVRLYLQTSADCLTVSVSDSGVGIAAEDLPNIFQPFWQADRGERTAGGGTGLGLSVVQRVVKLLGGQVSVASQVGEGSTFAVSLPLA